MSEANNIKEHELKSSVRSQIVFEFRKNSHLTDKSAIKSLLQEGERGLKLLSAMNYKNSLNGSNIPSYQNSVEDDMRVGVGWPWQRNEHS